MNPIKFTYDEYTDEELLKLSRKEALEGLTERQAKFCEYFVEGHNRKMSLVKAGYVGNQTEPQQATRLMKAPKIQRYIQWLKVRALNEHMIKAYDILDEWIRIAFSDITDFVEIFPHSIRLKPAEKIDGQLVKSIKSGRDGISIELYDKMRALDQLARYTADMPNDWKEKLELRRQELAEQEFDLKKKLYELSNPEPEDDGLLKAIQNSVDAIWEEENN